MKKKNLKSFKLNKKTISGLETGVLKGGTFQGTAYQNSGVICGQSIACSNPEYVESCIQNNFYTQAEEELCLEEPPEIAPETVTCTC